MKNCSLILGCIILFWSCGKENKKDDLSNTFQVKVNSEIAISDTFFLKQVIGSNLKTIDSLIVSDKKEFAFEGKLKEAGFFSLQSKNIELYSFFALDNEPITIYLAKNELLYVKSYSGSSLNGFLQKIDGLNARFQTLTDSLNKLYILYSNTNPSAGSALMTDYQNESKKFNFKIKDLIKSNPKNIVSVYATEFLDKEKEISFLDSLAADFKSQNSTSDYILSFITNTEKMSSNAVGSKARDFSLNTPDGNKISLSDYKGKYTLIDFWASWCGPCRKENPALVKVFQKYKNKNFDILGVSLDDDLVKWKNAITADKLDWKHVSDLKGWDNEVAVMYGVESIPQSFLIDTEGKIIAKSIRSEELDTILEKLLK